MTTADNPLDLNGGPLSIVFINRIIIEICTEGEVHVVNAQKMGIEHAMWLVKLMSKYLSEEDRAWIRETIRQELYRARGSNDPR